MNAIQKSAVTIVVVILVSVSAGIYSGLLTKQLTSNSITAATTYIPNITATNTIPNTVVKINDSYVLLQNGQLYSLTPILEQTTTQNVSSNENQIQDTVTNTTTLTCKLLDLSVFGSTPGSVLVNVSLMEQPMNTDKLMPHGPVLCGNYALAEQWTIGFSNFYASPWEVYQIGQTGSDIIIWALIENGLSCSPTTTTYICN